MRLLRFLLKPLADLALFIGLILLRPGGPAKRAVSFALRPFKMKNDILVRRGGEKAYVNSVDRLAAALLWKYSLFSGFEERLYLDRVKAGMTVLEIGANIGFFTLLFSRLAGGAGRVISFEPDPGNFRLLEKNIEANACGNVVCVRKAVSDKTGAARLFRSEEHHGDHRIFDSSDGRGSVEIEAAAIDDFLPAGAAVDFIKLDVQGAEYAALLGMERTILTSGKLVMLCEFSPGLLIKAGAGPGEMLKKLAGYGFSLKYLDEETDSIKSATQEELLALCQGEKYLNLLLEKNPGADMGGRP